MISQSDRSAQKANASLTLWFFGICVVALPLLAYVVTASVVQGEDIDEPLDILAPASLDGASGYNDQRDADLFPAIAYASGRYLVVWLTPRNASSSSDGFDVYGLFLDRFGQPLGSEFRISDRHTVARNIPPTVAAGNGEFVVAWTARATTCGIYVQRVLDSGYQPDHPLITGVNHLHSPSIVYNPTRRRYTMAYVDGDDYSPATLFNSSAADCGDNALSTSGIRAVEFHFDGGNPIIDSKVVVSNVGEGAFRPDLAYSGASAQYLAIWEDRRSAAGNAHLFGVYALRLKPNLTPIGTDFPLAGLADYTNGDGSANWTPRPATAAGKNGFLTTWFSKNAAPGTSIWSVNSRLVPTSGPAAPSAIVTSMTFAQDHPGRAPAGFLEATYNYAISEYLVGLTSQLETVWGYISFARIQRVRENGELLNLAGSVRSSPGVGDSIDYDNDGQIFVALTANPVSGVGASDYMIAYSKHTLGQHAQDFDIWGVRMQTAALNLNYALIPSVAKD